MTGRFPSTLYTVAQIRTMEAQAAPLLAGGIWDLVEAASDALLEYLRVHWPRTQRVTVCCGTGNNGADGWLLAHKAQARGLRVVVLIPARFQRFRRLPSLLNPVPSPVAANLPATP